MATVTINGTVKLVGMGEAVRDLLDLYRLAHDPVPGTSPGATRGPNR